MKRLTWLLALLFLAPPVRSLADDGPVHEGIPAARWAERLRGDDLEAAMEAQEAFLDLGAAGVPTLIGMLERQDFHARHVALHTLALLGPEAVGAREPLVQALAYPQPPLRILAAEALGRMGPEAGDSLDAVYALLADPSPFLAWAGDIAVRGIEQTPPFEAAPDPEVEGRRVSQWVWRAVSPHREQRRRAWEVLTDQPHDVVLPWMLRWIYRESALIRRTEPQWARMCSNLPSEAAVVVGLATAENTKRVVAMAQELGDRDVECMAIRFLREGGADVTPFFRAFLELTRRATGNTRGIALEVLAKATTPDPVAVPLLVEHLQEHGLEDVAAVHLLGRLQQAAVKALPALEKLREDAPDAASWAAEDVSLAIRRIQAGDEALVAAYAEEARGIRYALLRTLAEEPVPAARRRALIEKALVDPDRIVARRACEWLLELGAEGEALLLERAVDPKLLPHVLDAIDTWVYVHSENELDVSAVFPLGDYDMGESREVARDFTPFVKLAIEALAAKGDARSESIDLLVHVGTAAAEAAPLLREILASDDWLDHREAAEALGAVTAGTSEAVEELVGHLEHGSHLLPVGAAIGLSRVGQPAAGAVPAVLDRLRRYASSDEGKAEGASRFPSYDVTQYAEALSRFARLEGETVGAIVGASEDDAREVRWACVHALGTLRDPPEAVLDALAKRVRDEDETVAVEAVTGVVRIAESDLHPRDPSRLPYDLLDSFQQIRLQRFDARAQANPAVRIVQQAQEGADERMRRILQEGIRRGRDPMAAMLER